MRFQNIIILNLLIVVIPILIYVYFRIIKKYNQTIDLIGDKKSVLRLLSNVDLNKKKKKIVFILAAFIIILISLARPQAGSKTIEVKRKGVDVLIALDTSLSMLAEDVKPNRQEKAKQEIVKLINALRGDRVGLIGFAGSAFTMCPLTLDKNTAKMFLSILDNEIMPVAGTAISDAINLAIKSFSQKERKYKVLILITDGEDHIGNIAALAQRANEDGIKIFTIGIGKQEGEPIPLRDKKGKKIGYKKDKQGNVVITRLNEEVLNKIASITGGQYYHVVSGDWGLYKIYEKIRAMDKKELKSKMTTVYEEKFQYILIFAILLLLLEFFMSDRKKKRKNILDKILKSKKILIIILLGCSIFAGNIVYAETYKQAAKEYNKGNFDKSLEIYSENRKEKDNPQVSYNIGNIYYRKNDFEKAQQEYTAVESENKQVMFQSYYNSGNTYYKQGKLKEAVSAYKKALDINAEDIDTKYNLEFINKMRKPQDQEQQKQDQKKQEQEKQDQEQEKQEQEEQDQEQQEQQKQEQEKQEQEKKEQEKQEQEKKEQQKQGQEKKEQQKQEQEKKDQEQQEQEKKEQEKKEQEKKEQEKKEQEKKEQEKKEQQKQEKQEQQEKKDDKINKSDKIDKQKQQKEISKEEAEMFLNQIDEDKEILKQIKKRQTKYKQKQIKKDW
jgi:Ca-activated chloride channel homolog